MAADPKATRDLFLWAVRGDGDAADLCMSVFEWSNLYDHLIDKQAIDEEETLHQAMWKIGVVIGSNPFYCRNVAQLSVTIGNAITTWRAATELQRRGTEHGKQLAYVMRWFPIEFFLHCARLVGGPEWAADIAPHLWMKMTEDYPYSEFDRECGNGLGTVGAST